MELNHVDINAIKEAELSVFQWIELWYNTNRIHSSLGNKSIKEFAKSNKNIANHI